MDHFAFRVSDLNASIKFYRETLGWTLLSQKVDETHHEAFAFFELKGGNLELLQSLDENNDPIPFEKPKIESPFCPHVAIASKDLEKQIERLKEKNVPIIKGPLEIPDLVKWLYISDLDNNIVEFVQWLEKK